METTKSKVRREESPYKWGMAIDLDRCTGCGACVVACHAENNVPFVGKKMSGYGRAMHWLRIERYWEGEYPNVRARFIPVLCQHCEDAPCEPVCPVYASYHNAEGLNAQVYNRCVGTRYCANNCPYSVRYFNFFEPHWPKPLDQQLSPDVTVRSKGIMEKCSFCIQRIRRGKETAKLAGRMVRDGEIQPACAQTCPPEAIVFGNMADPASRVFRLAQSPRRFRLIEDLGTDPAVIYLKGGGREHVK
jgi:molybdopterin-containing oxidoreductase family iron-sulfur binding subunit